MAGTSDTPMAAGRSRRASWTRVVVATAFGISFALSMTSFLRPGDEYLDLDSDGSIANAFAVSLWFIVALLAIFMARRTKARVGWISVTFLSAFVALGEAYDFKDTVIPLLISSNRQDAWLIVVGPIAIPGLFLASRALLGAARTMSQRIMLLTSMVFAVASLPLDPIEPPLGIAEEGSELFSSVVLIALLVSFLGWVPISHSLINWRLIVLLLAFTALSGGILLLREYWIPVAGTSDDSPEVHHGPLSAVSQDLHVDHAFLSRIDVWAETSDGSADLFLRLSAPEESPIRESRATTSNRRWSGKRVSFTFSPVAESGGRTWEITVGALQPTPYVFLGLSSDDPIPGSVVRVNESSDPWSNDLALHAYTFGRGGKLLLSMVQYRTARDVLIAVEILLAWLWVATGILWFTSSRSSFVHLRDGDERGFGLLSVS